MPRRLPTTQSKMRPPANVGAMAIVFAIAKAVVELLAGCASRKGVPVRLAAAAADGGESVVA